MDTRNTQINKQNNNNNNNNNKCYFLAWLSWTGNPYLGPAGGALRHKWNATGRKGGGAVRPGRHGNCGSRTRGSVEGGRGEQPLLGAEWAAGSRGRRAKREFSVPATRKSSTPAQAREGEAESCFPAQKLQVCRMTRITQEETGTMPVRNSDPTFPLQAC